MKASEYLKSPEYWLEKIQNDIFAELNNYKEENALNQNELAMKMKVSKGYVSQILNGNFNFTIRKLIELMLWIGKVPVIKFITLQQYQNNKKLIDDFFLNISNNDNFSKAKELKSNEHVFSLLESNNIVNKSVFWHFYLNEYNVKEEFVNFSIKPGERLSA